jgi:hypothetical protein
MLLGILVLVLALAAVGFFVHVITTNVTMSPGMQQIIIGASVLFCALWVLMVVFGVAPLPHLPKF